MLGTYTAVLISDTAMPLWRATRRTTPAYFGASSLVAATSLLDLVEQDEREATIVHRLGVAARLVEVAAGEALERSADQVEHIGRPLHEGASGTLWRVAKGCTAASLVVSVLPVGARRRRTRRVAAAALAPAGSLVSRFAMLRAGTASARDPRATFDQQRTGHGAAEITGRAAVTGSGGRRAL